MPRATTKFLAAPLRSGTWLVRERAGGALSDTLVPPGTLPPQPGGEPEGCWRLCWRGTPALGVDGEAYEARRLTVREALVFARADGEQRAWVYERSILYAGHLLSVTAEHLAYDRRRGAAVRRILTDPAIALLDEVREAATGEGLSDEARQLAVSALPELALTLLGISDELVRSDVVVSRAG